MKKKVKILGVALIILVFAIALLLGKDPTSRMIASLQGEDNKAEYKEVTEEDYKTQSDNVKFAAYFVSDDKQVDGTNNRIGYSDTLYFNLKLSSGTLRNAKIQINSQNFYLDTNLMEDSVISTDYVSANTKEIALKEISGNVEKIITGAVKSGNYEFPTSKAEAIGEDISNYSKENTIVFSADYIDESNNTTTITKEIPITVDWYGSINIEIPNQVYGNDNLNQKYNISNYLDETNGEMTLEFKVAVQETTNEVLIKKSYVEGIVPLVNNIAPTNVVVEGENVNYTYDPNTQKFTASREAVLSGNTINEEAYSGVYAQNEIQYRYNEYTVKATYPIDAYLVDDDEYIDISVPVSGYYEGFNGEKSEQISSNISVAYSNMDNETTGFRAFIGRNVLYPIERQVVSKRNILLAYRYNNNQTSTQIESEYYTRWNVVTKLGEQVDKAVLTDNHTKDVFIDSTGAEIANNDYIYNKGIAFSNPISALGENGWIDVYNDETDELIHRFTVDDWSNYDTLNPYEYAKDVNYIRVETSTVAENSMLTVYNVKGFNIDRIKQDFTQDTLENITQIKTHFRGTMQIAGETTEYSTEENAYFEDETSVVNFTTSKNEINTQTSNKLQIEINPNVSQYNTSTWTDEQYLIKLPEDIINLSINNITTDNQENSRIKNYYQYRDNGNIFIKIEMEGEGFSSYRLLLDCIVETNPTAQSKTSEVELYAYNSENNVYYTTDQSEDIYDLNNNNNTSEIIGKKTDTISIVQEDTLLTYQSTSDATPENDTIYAPLTAIVENEDRTATVDITLQNNKETSISDVKVLGTMPFAGNKYQLTGEDLGSTYNAELVSDGIVLPDELARYATVYYSTNVDVNDDTTDPSNNWTLAPDSYTDVKHFLIVFNRYEIQPDEKVTVSYKIRIPEQIEYNEVSYSAHTVYYSENTETETSRKTVEVNKLGFMLTKRVNLNIATISKEDNSGVEGATFKLVEMGTRGTTTLKETNAEGQVSFEQLFLERDYTLEQIGVSDDYVRNQDVISFRAYEEDGQIKLNVTNGNMNYSIDQDTKTVQVTMNNEVRYDFELTNLSTTGEAIQSTFTLTGNGQNFEQETSQDGKTVFTGLYPEQEYTLTQTYSKGYYIEDNSSVTFKLTRTDSGLVLQTISGSFANSGSIDDTVAIKPVLRQTIQNEAIPTFNLKVTLYESGKIIPLESAQYRITGGGIENGALYTTDARGTFTVPDLYVHVDGKNVTGEYTLKEIEPTVGYALAQTDIKLVVSRNPSTQELTLNVTNGSIREEYEIVDNTVSIGIENSIIFNITSRDGETVELLPGVKLMIKELVIENDQEFERDPMDADGNILGETQIINGESCQVFTTNENGIIEEALRNGIYKIVKIEVPYGYHLEENEEDRTYYVGIGETRGADVEAEFREPLELSGSGDSQPDDYYVAGRDDGMGLFYHRGSLSLINDDNEVVRTISSNQALQIIDDNGTFVVLESSRIVKYNDNLDVIATIDLTNGMEKFATTSDGGYVIVGNYSGTKTISGNLTSNGQSLSITSTRGYDGGFFQENTVDIFVVKVDANGKVSNLAGFGGAGAWREPGEDRATYVTVNNNGDYVISAHIESEEISGSMMASGSDISGTFDDCYFIMDSDTMKVSQIVTVGTTRGNIEATEGNAHRAFAGVDGGVYYVGQMSGTVTFSGSQTASGQAITVKSTGDTDAYAVKFNSEGKVEWAIAVGGTNTDHIYSAEYTPDGELLIGGDSNGGAITVDGSKTSSGISINTEPIGDSASTWRGIALKIDSRGRVVWANEFGYAQNEGIYAFAGFTGNSYVICGFDDADNNLNNGRSDVYIRVDEAEGRQEISEVKGIEITTNKERYNITTSVNGVGGTITGQDQEIFETIVHGENATKPITVTPNEGYEILAIKVNGEKIPFTTDDNGIATIEPMQNITQNTNIVAEFSNNTSKIIVHHYLLGTNTKVAEDDVYVGIVGEEYTTSPKADLSGYELAISDGEYIVDGEVYGTYGEYDKEIIYYYQEKTARLTVNYFIEGTNTPLSPSVSYEVEKGESYNTEEPAYIPEEYELVAQPNNKSGIIEESEIVVTYYYRLKPTYEYKIEYYYDGNLDDALTQTGEEIENKVIDTYTPQLKEGYVFDHTEGLPLTISTDINNNIIKVYYKAREDLRYTVEYYYDGVKEDSEVYTNIKFGTVITQYEDRVKEGYQLEKVEGTPLTIGVNEQNNIIKVYYTIRKDLYYTVHYYEENSTIEAAPDKEVGGNTYHSIVTENPIDIEGYTKVSSDSQNITIQVDESQNVITFYYIKHAQIPQNELIKTGPDTITTENEVLEYTITYTGVISGYKGNATITLVDTLPYQINTNTAELDGGQYDSAKNTITWVENLQDIDTNTNGNMPVNITKTIRVAYTNIDYSNTTITNRISGNMSLARTGQEIEIPETTKNTTTQFTKEVTVTKQWNHTNNIYGIPTQVEIQVKNGEEVADSHILNESNQVEGNANTWTYTFTGLQKYNDQGQEINYTVDEVGIGEGELRYYSKNIQGNTITNTYIGPVISATKEAKTENGLNYVVEGEKITYTITVKNDGQIEKDVIVKDTIPEGTTLNGKIKINNEDSDYTSDNLNDGITVNVPKQGQTTISFTVTVNTLEGDSLTKQLSNTAIVDGKEVGPVNNTVNKSDLKFWKESEPQAGTDVKAGDTITYTITLDNSKGTAPTTAIVKDTVPTGTTFVVNSIKINNGETSYTQDNLANGISIDLADHETKTISFQVNVNDLNDKDTISNTATVNDTNTDPITHRYVEPIISASKASTTENNLSYAVEGETITYCITVENSGNLAGKATIKDLIPEGTTFVPESVKINDAQNVAYTESSLKDGIEVDVPALGQTTLSFEVTVKELEENVFEKEITNTAKVNEVDTNTVTNTVNKPNVIASKEASPQPGTDVKEGDIITYTIRLDNSKGTAPTSVLVKDTVPTGTTFAGNMTLDGFTIDNNESDLADGISVSISAHQIRTLSFQVKVGNLDNAQEITNKANVDGKDTNQVTHRYVEPIISSRKESSIENARDYVLEGEIITYTITLTNEGFTEGIALLKDVIPAGTSFVNGSVKENGAVRTYTEEDLKNGINVQVPKAEETEDGVNSGTANITFEVRVNNLPEKTYEATITNKANVNGTDTNEVNNTVYKSNVVASKESETAGQDVEQNDIITYKVKLDNSLGTAPDTVVVKDLAPIGTTFIPGTIKENNKETEYTEDNLKNGISVNIEAHEVKEISFQVQVNDLENATLITNTAEVNNIDTNTITNRYVEPIITATKELSTENSLAYVVEGETITYTITVENRGFTKGTANITDQIPQGTTFVDKSVRINGVKNETYTAENLRTGIQLEVPAGEETDSGVNPGTVTLSFEVTVNELAQNVFERTITNTANVNGTNTNTVNNTVNKPNVVPSKTAEPAEGTDVKQGDVITYYITLDNSLGTAPDTVLVKDSIPTGTSFVEGSIKENNVVLSETGSDNLENGINVSLNPHETKVVSFQVKVNDLDDTANISNTATVDEVDTNTVTHRYVEPIINAEKSSTTENKLSYVVEGETITYYITVKNTGHLAGKTTIIDEIPEGTTFVQNSIKVNNSQTQYTEDNLKAGIEVDVTALGQTTLSFDVTVNPLEDEALVKTLTNTAIVNNEEVGPVNNIVNKSDLKFWKQANPTAGADVKTGDTITYTITLDNSQGTAPTTAVVKDAVPQGTTFVENSIKIDNGDTSNTEDNLASGISIDLADHETKTLSFQVKVGDLDNGTQISNTATVNDTDTEAVTHRYVEPIISASKAVSTQNNLNYVVEGETITYTVTVNNAGYLAGKATIKDPIPDGTTFVENSVRVNNGETQYTLENLRDGIEVDVPAQGSTTLSFRVTVNTLDNGIFEKEISNTAKVNEKDTNTVTSTVNKPNVIPSKSSVPAEGTDVIANDTITYTITLDNSTGTAPTTVNVKDNVPEGTTFVTGSVVLKDRTTRYTEEELASGINVDLSAHEVATLSFRVTVNDLANRDTISNTATVNDVPTKTITHRYIEPIISATKESSTEHNLDYVVEGEVITYKITVKNSGDLEGKATIKDSIPEGTSFVQGSIKINDEEREEFTSLNLQNGIDVEVPALGQTTLTFQVRVNTLPEGTFEKQISNTATVNDVNTNSVQETVNKPNVIVTKESDKAGTDVKAGDKITYTIRLDNSLGTAPTSVVVKDEAPIGTTFEDGSISLDGKPLDNVEKDLNNGISINLAPHEVKTLSFQVTVQDIDNGTQITNTAKADDKDTNEVTSRYVEPIISATKEAISEHSLDYVVEGERITYKITVNNAGYLEGKATIKDNIPEGTTFVAESIKINDEPQTSYTSDSLKDGIEVNVPAEGSTTISFDVTVNKLAQGILEKEITNTAKVNEVDTNSVNSTVNKPNVIPSKQALPLTGTDVKAEDVITYSIKLDNSTGTAPTTVNVKDTVPNGTTFVDGSIKVTDDASIENLEQTTEENLASGINVELEAHQTKTLSFQVRVEDLDNGTEIKNIASVNNVQTNEITHRYVEPIISATKEAISEHSLDYVVEGERITYKITVNNAGYLEGKATIKDNIPEGTSFVAESIKINDEPQTSYTSDSLKDGIEVNVPAEGSTTISFDVTVNKLAQGILEKEITNTAKVNEVDTNSVNSTVNKPNVIPSKTAEPESGRDVKVGDVITYTIRLDNNTGTAPTTVNVKDTVPSGTTFVDGSIKIADESQPQETAENLASGINVDLSAHETKELSFQVSVNDLDNGTQITNTATVNDVPTDTITHRYVEPIITATKASTTEEGLGYVVEDETITYTITVKNDGDLAGNAIIKDSVPEGTTFVQNSIKVNGEESAYTEQNLKEGITEQVPARDQITVSFDVTVDHLQGDLLTKVLTNTATVNGTQTKPVLNTVNKSNVKFWKEAEPEETDVKQGDTITYHIKLDNSTGTAPASVTVKDNIPQGTTLVEGSITVEGKDLSKATTETLAEGISVDLQAYETKTLTFQVTVGDLDNGAQISNTAMVNDVPTNEITHRYVEPIISATKEVSTEHSLDYVVEGETITYSITAENRGFLDGKATIKDNIPEGTSFVAGSIKINNEEQPEYTDQNLQSGIEVDVPSGTETAEGVKAGTTTLSFAVTVNTLPDEILEKTITNTAKVNEVDTNTVNSTVNKPNVIISKDVNPADGTDVKAGDVITYYIKLDNSTGTAPTTVNVKDNAPEGTTFIDGSINITNTTSTENLRQTTIDDLENGINVELEAHQTKTLSFQVRVGDLDNGAQISNTAKVDEKDTNKVTNRYVEPIISSNKTASTEHNLDYVVEGETITYTITVNNSGFLAGNATIIDNIPEGTSFVTGSIKVNNENTEYTANELKGGITLNVPAEGSTVLSFEVTVNELEGETLQKDITNTATVNNIPTETVTETVKKPHVSIRKEALTSTGKEQVIVGDTITYRITLNNSTGTAPTTVNVKDSVPEGTTFVEDSIKVNDIDENYTLDNLTNGIDVPIMAGEIKTVTFQVKVNDLENGQEIKNTATVNDTNTNEVTNTYIEPIITSNKKMTTQYGLDYVVQGEKVGYTITATNEGDLAKDVIVKDTIPEGTTLLDGSITIDNTETQYTADDLQNGIKVNVPERTSVIVRFVVTVDQNATEIVNIANVDGTDTNKTQIPVVSFEKSAEVIRTTTENIEAGRVTASDKIKYTITINNLGQEAVDSIIVKDQVPEGTTLSSIGNGGTTNGSQEIIWNINNLQDKVAVSYEVTVNYDSQDTKEIKNTATVDGKDTNEVTTTYQKPTIKETSSIEKTGTEVIKSVDDEITYRITYTATINDFVGEGKVTIVDSLPYSVNVANKYLDGGVYDQITKTITWQEDLGHIDTYLNDEKQINIVKDITVKYVYEDEEHLSGTITNNVEATLELTQEDNKVLESKKQTSCGTRVEIPAKVIVHHYIYDKENKEYTKVKIAEDSVIEGIIGTPYTAEKADVRADYTCINETPENYTGTMTKSDIEVTFYYELKDTQIGSVIEKEAQADKTEEIEVGTGKFNEDGSEITETKLVPVLTKEDGEVTYKISYRIGAKDYKGKVTASIVDTLPYEIDVSKSDFGGGIYNSRDNTITWNEERNVDTFANGMYDETIEKQFTVVYVDQDVTKPIVNTVTGNMFIYYPEVHSTKPGEIRLSGQTETTAEVAQEYKVNKTVEKVWDDNDNLKQRRPDSVTVQLTANDSTSYKGKELEKVVLSDENNWTYTFTNLPKYTDQGFEIKYSVIETETNPGDLEYYDKAKVEEFTNVIRVTNKYKLMNINLDSNITKTGTELITSSKDEVNYSINYKATVNNYIGEALVTIVDTLPYEIDESLSNLNGGTYDNESKTITWRETIDHINTYVNGDYKVDITKDITVVFNNLDATQRKMTNIAQGTIDLYETETTNTKATTYDTNMEIPGKVVVKYVDKDSGEEIVKEEQDEEGNIVEGTYGYEIDGLAGDSYTTEQKEIYGYTYVENTNNTEGNMKEGIITVIYYYVRTDSQGVIVKYVDQDGNEIADTELITGKVKDSYQTIQKDIPNYDFVRVEGETQGELVEETINVTYIYKKIPAKVIVQYLEKDDTPDDNSDNIILANEQVIEGFSGDSYTTTRVNVDNYMAYGEDPANATGVMTREDIYVVYYYERKPSGIITVKYVDADTNKEILYKDESGEYVPYTEQLQGLCGLEYTTEAKDIPYYNFVEDQVPENKNGIYSEEDIEVIYYYTKKEFNLSVEKQINRITVNGQEHSLKEGLDQIDVVASKVQETDIVVTYKIIVSNPSEVEGSALVQDNIPEFFKVTDGTSPEWTQTANKTLEAEVTLQPGETKELLVVLKWINNNNNFGLQTNNVTLQNVINPANFEESNLEDNSATAEVMLSVKTGGIDESIVIVTALIIMLGALVITIYQKEKKTKK